MCGNYGGYFYFNSQKEGLDAFDDIRNMVSADISPDVDVFLKRGCTEYEQRYGDSSGWAINPDQKQVEEDILSKLVFPDVEYYQSDIEKESVLQRWVEFAYDRGDITYSSSFNKFTA